MNMNNVAILRGRLVADPATFANKDGSTKVKFSLACENNYKNKDGKRDAQIIPVEAFVKADFDKSPFAHVHKGDKVSVEASLRMNNYTKQDGTKIYDTIVFVEGLQFEESRATTEARAAANAAGAIPAEAPATAE